MKTKQIRQAYGEALVRIGEKDKRIIVLDSDVSNSTKSCLFGEKFPERFFNVGIFEANMAGMAAGFATTGKILLLILLQILWFFVLVIRFIV